MGGLYHTLPFRTMERFKVVFVVVILIVIAINVVITPSMWLCTTVNVEYTSDCAMIYVGMNENVLFITNITKGIPRHPSITEENVSTPVNTSLDILSTNSNRNGFLSQHLYRLTEEGKKSLPYKQSISTSNLGSQSNFSSTELPIVLEWSNFYGLSLFEDPESVNEYCPYVCNYTTSRNLRDVAAVTVYHMGMPADWVPTQSSKNQSFINIFLNFEPPPHRLQYKTVKTRLFDATITYRQDSTIPVYYDSLVPLDGPNDTDRWTDAEVDAAIQLKQKTALWMVSHCETYSERETYVAELIKHMHITQIGKCNKKKCPMFEDCEKKLIKTHYFYIAFENSVCLDYITEKFFRLRQLIVPIVLDRRVFRGIHERLLNYTIVASDFESPKHLADYLDHLIAHPDEYRKYFEWTKIYKKSPQPFYTDETACKICEIAHQAQNGTFVKRKLAIQKWWGGNICYDHVGSALAFHNRSLDTFWNGL